MKKTFPGRVLVWLVIFLLGTLLTAGQADAQTDNKNGLIPLSIVTINDFHGALAAAGKNPGAAQLVQFLREIKAQNPAGTLLVSAGDMFQGSLDSNLVQGKTVVEVMNYVSFDAMTLGNHEFDWGESVLKERIIQSAFPYVCANVLDKQTGKPLHFVKPYTIIERSGIKIGIIGIATPETAMKTNPNMIANYTFADPVQVLTQLVPQVRKNGANIILVLSHLGSTMDAGGAIGGEAAVVLQQVEGIDALVSGHTHEIVQGKVNGIPVVQAYYNGRAVGKIDLLVNAETCQVQESSSRAILVPTSERTGDSTVQAILEQGQKAIEPVKNKVIGHTIHPLSHDRYAFSETVLGQWVTDTMRQAATADIAFYNTGGLRTGISAGTVTMGNLYEVLPFDSTLCVVELTGRQILQVLEYGLMNSKVGMVQYSGITVVYDARGAEGERVASVTLADGTALFLDKRYKVAVNDFMAAGGDGFVMFREGANFRDTNILVRDFLVDTFRKQTTISLTGDDRFRIIQVTGKEQKEAA